MPPEEIKRHNFNIAQVNKIKGAYAMLSSVIEPFFGNAGEPVFPHYSEEYKMIQEILEMIETTLGVLKYKKKK